MGDHAVRHVIVADKVVDVDLVRRVLQFEMVVHGDELQRLGSASASTAAGRATISRKMPSLPRCAMIVRPSATAAEADRVIEVMMRLNHLRHPLARDEGVHDLEIA